jgi:hypothetical protein
MSLNISSNTIETIKTNAIRLLQLDTTLCYKCDEHYENLKELTNVFPSGLYFCNNCVHECTNDAESLNEVKERFQVDIVKAVNSITKQVVKTLNSNPQKKSNEAATVQPSEKKLENLKNAYDVYISDYVNNKNNDIYDAFENVAKKKFYKDSGCAKYQEQIFQDFIQNGKNWGSDCMFNADKHAKLITLREKANAKDEK